MCSESSSCDCPVCDSASLVGEAIRALNKNKQHDWCLILRDNESDLMQSHMSRGDMFDHLDDTIQARIVILLKNVVLLCLRRDGTNIDTWIRQVYPLPLADSLVALVQKGDNPAPPFSSTDMDASHD